MSIKDRRGIISETHDDHNNQAADEMHMGILEGNVERTVNNRPDITSIGIYDNGHATREDLMEEDESTSNEVKRNERLIRMSVDIGFEDDIYAVIDTGATHSCISPPLYVKLREGKLILGELPVRKVTLVVAVGKRIENVNKRVVFEMKWNGDSYNVHALGCSHLWLLG